MCLKLHDSWRWRNFPPGEFIPVELVPWQSPPPPVCNFLLRPSHARMLVYVWYIYYGQLQVSVFNGLQVYLSVQMCL